MCLPRLVFCVLHLLLRWAFVYFWLACLAFSLAFIRGGEGMRPLPRAYVSFFLLACEFLLRKKTAVSVVEETFLVYATTAAIAVEDCCDCCVCCFAC